MIETDFDTFGRAFKRASRVLRLNVTGTDLDELQRAYFRILEPHQLDAVLDALKTCVTTCRAFPRPHEVIAALPKTSPTPTATADVRVMGETEARDYDRAERLRYEDSPCSCLLCEASGASALPRRFVPSLTFDGVEERARHPQRGVVLAGEWIHGDVLVRWWYARNAFFAVAPKAIARLLGRRRSARERIDEIFKPTRDREPGEDD